MNKKGSEFFSLDENGERVDRVLHETILEDGDGRAEEIGVQVARELGMSEEAIRRLYPPHSVKKVYEDGK